MNKIVRQNYPVSRLPEDLRPTADLKAVVTVIVESTPTSDEKPPEHGMTFEEIYAARRPPYRTKEEIDADIRRDRDSWDD